MNNEEKILEILSIMQTQMGQMQTQMGQMQTQMGQMQTKMGEMQTQMDRMEARQDRVDTRLDRVDTRLDRIEARQDQVQDDLQRVKLYLELDVEKRLAAINEGIDTIQERLIPEERMEKAEDDIIVLKTAVRALACDVAELKKAE